MGRPFNMSPTVYGAVISASIHLPRHYRAHDLLATTNYTMKIKKFKSTMVYYYPRPIFGVKNAQMLAKKNWCIFC
jgi:hypothetical protein